MFTAAAQHTFLLHFDNLTLGSLIGLLDRLSVHNDFCFHKAIHFNYFALNLNFFFVINNTSVTIKMNYRYKCKFIESPPAFITQNLRKNAHCGIQSTADPL